VEPNDPSPGALRAPPSPSRGEGTEQASPPPRNQPLPIDDALPQLTAGLATGTAAVLVASPGAGKTTRVPLVLAGEPWAQGKRILVLEPRRLAARAAAARMAQTLGERVGETVGLRVRFGSQVSRRTRIEVLTEGVFIRRILDDPMLDGVAAVLFDEFHERSLDADLGLALALDAQRGLRDDLKLLVMSATLDGARVARLLGDASVVEAQGRAFPVETRYLGRDARAAVEPQVADAVVRALGTEPGSILAFLPGAAEIRRTAQRLRERLSNADVDIVPLYGALDAATQDRAVAPARPGRRKVVLATSIAETSLTIEGVRVVVDCGLARVPRYEPEVGLTLLETVRVSRAAADQRRGRAGRTEPGICYRLWEEPQTASLEPFSKPEILSADLAGFGLDLASWGVADPAALSFLDTPPTPALNAARTLLRELGAVDADGRITDEGRRLRRLPLPPRLARMVVDAADEGAAGLAADIAAVLAERGLGGDDIDLRHRVEEFRRDREPRAADARRMAQRWAEMASDRFPSAPGNDSPDGRCAPSPLVREGWGGGSRGVATEVSDRRTPTPAPSPQGGGETRDHPSVGALLALAYPERIAKNRGGVAGFVMASGRGGVLDPASPLAGEPFLAVAEVAGSSANARIRLAAPISSAEIEARFADRIETREEVTFEEASLGLRARRVRTLGALLLAEQPGRVSPSEETARLLAAAIGRLGLTCLPWTERPLHWRERVAFMRRLEGAPWPDLSDAALTADLGWIETLLASKTSLPDIRPDELEHLLEPALPWDLRQRLDAEAPTHFAAPSGSRVPIDYAAAEGPRISVRVQEMFGLARHPAIGGGRVPLIVELTSPARRPVQVTRDLPGFWRGSYAAVKAEMRGRYPRHPWPDDPLAAPATRRAKRRQV
jgi:ATP-dependent helicase HrpB